MMTNRSKPHLPDASAIPPRRTEPFVQTYFGAAQVKYIGILLFDGAEELDIAGPWEVLSYWCRTFPTDGYSVVSLSQSADAVQCAQGMTMRADYTIASAPPLAALLYPGGSPPVINQHLADDAHLAWVRQVRDDTPLMISVCVGALVYAAAGILANREATTHWNFLERLAELDPSIAVRGQSRFVDAGDVITSAGVSAGIDMALHLVSRLADVDRARLVRRVLQYDPQPPV
jgi:transcriptional regulator GlxA family with amidase domain